MVPKVEWGTHVLKSRSRVLIMSSQPYVGPYAKTWARGGRSRSFLSSAERRKGNDVWSFWSSGSYCGDFVPIFVLGGKEFSFWPTSKRRGVWARTVKR